VEAFPEFRRKGIATQLYKELKRINPEYEIKHTMTLSDEGSA
jgi:GNAT superfamily N-acetyltransferase